ncbi:ATP-binding protein [candidate division WOR-3 bacterium]|nr:ATP-binding protein [candidate division WOR-3 bacterium]
MNKEGIFSDAKIKWLFETRKNNPSLIRRKESDVLEYKENFNWVNKIEYVRLFCSFANHRGGYIIFGIKDKPHELIGLQNDRFSVKDPSQITQYLNEHFSPSMEWYSFEHEKNGNKFGVIYVEESKSKPIMCIKHDTHTSDIIREGTIYYRYSGQTKVIRAIDLQGIINERIEIETRSWQEMLVKMAKLRPEHAEIFDVEKGMIELKDKTIIIDESILSKIRFIKEGELNEKEGTPTLKLVGSIKTVPEGGILPVKKVKVPMGIHRNDIYNAFFKGKCDYPEGYLEQLVYENTYYLPLWFFIEKANLSIERAINILNEQKGSNNIRKKLVERLKNDVLNYKLGRIFVDVKLQTGATVGSLDPSVNRYLKKKSLPKRRKNTVKRSCILIFLKKYPHKIMENKGFIKKNSHIILEACTHIDKNDIRQHKSKYLALLKKIYEILTKKNRETTEFRKAVCYLDIKLYKKEPENKKQI